MAEVGLPQKAIPVALLMFNVGVEVGQLIFVAFVIAIRRVLIRLLCPKQPWIPYATPYAIGCVAMFWVIERISAFF